MTNHKHGLDLLFSRRDLLQRSGVGLGMLGLAGVLSDRHELGAAPVSHANPLAP